MGWGEVDGEVGRVWVDKDGFIVHLVTVLHVCRLQTVKKVLRSIIFLSLPTPSFSPFIPSCHLFSDCNQHCASSQAPIGEDRVEVLPFHVL